MDRTAHHFLLALAPAALIGILTLGLQLAAVPDEAANVWQFGLAQGIGVDVAAPGAVGAMLLGSMFWLPLLVAALVTSFFWATVFARLRDRHRDPGWLLHAILFSLLLPATMPVGLAVMALSFGLVFGCHAFGGSGRYLVNPALLAIVFIAFAYPALIDVAAWLPGDVNATTWAVAAAGGTEAVRGAGTSLFDAFVGRELGAIGTTSAAACLAGAVYLIAVRRASAAVVAAGIAALIVAAGFFGDLPWQWQLALGNFAFVLAFIATDPTTRPKTIIGCSAFGALFGLLTIVLRTADPAHPEGTWAALLLASLVVPLIDHLTTRRHGNDAVPGGVTGGAP